MMELQLKLGPHTFAYIWTLVKRKNRTLIDMARSMLSEYNVSQSFWAEAINMLAIVATVSIVTH